MTWQDRTSRALLAAPLRILLVEDDTAYHRIAQAMLDNSERGNEPGYHLDTAEDLKAGLASIQASEPPYDVILLDLSLPDATGLDALDRMVDRFPHIPIIVVTASDDGVLASEAFRAGAQDYLVKGGTDDKLLFTLGRTIARHRHVREAVADARRLAAEDRERTAVAGRLKGDESLAKADPDTYRELLERYDALVIDGVRERVLEREPAVAAARVALAADLAARGVRGRDVIALHLDALRRAAERTKEDALGLWVEEARIAVLDVLASLTDLYRTDRGS